MLYEVERRYQQSAAGV